MRIAILTIFPDIFKSFLNASLIEKAVSSNKLTFEIINIRDFASGPHQQVDDIPYGGGAGMVMKPEPLSKAIEHAKSRLKNAPVILLSASGHLFSQQTAQNLSSPTELILICARYEGVDQRVVDKYVDMELSIGNYVLMGGEVASMVLIEAVTRLIPEVIGNQESLNEESFSISDESGLLIEGPQYTRPAEYAGQSVPDILLSGDHKKIAAWRRLQAAEKRESKRPDLKIK